MYTIKEVSEKLRISANSIRFYEKKGLITPLRGENGYREFTPEDLSRLQIIVLYRRMGFSIEAILEIVNNNVGTTILEQFSAQYNILNDHIHAMISIRETMGECIEKMLPMPFIIATMKKKYLLLQK
jgi:putative AdoMet-dependent methyltransferase